MSAYSRGSEWRRWDLHVHTPGTLKNDRFIPHDGSLEDRWDKFYSDVASYVGDGSDPLKRIAAIGITDYLSIENYKKVKGDNKLPSSIALILPNIEMRLAITAETSPINIHFIFDPAFDDSIESRFLNKLRFSYPGHDEFSASKLELIRLGKALDPSLDDKEAYKNGIEHFLPSIDSIEKLFESNPDMRDHVIVIVSNSSTDGVCGIGNANGQMQGVKRSILHFADGIFSGNPSDRDYYLGRKNGCPKESVIAECGALMPCFHGSDAHTNSKLFEPDHKRYCWIKSDPTFNGLKQVLYEPEERVYISETMPDYKPDYQVIDSVTFNNPSFPSDSILLNDKLVCIIGGKSTGKSIMIFNTAHTIDSEQVLNKTKGMTPPLNTSPEIDHLVVHWRGDQSETGIAHKIVYIPQTYLNHLSGDQSGEKTEIDKIIQEVIMQDNAYLASYKSMESSITEHKANIDKTIYDCIETQRDIVEVNAQKLEIGDKAGIKAEIRKLIEQKEILVKEASVSEDELRVYEDAIKQIDVLNRQVQSMSNEICCIENVDSLVSETKLTFACSDNTRTMLQQAAHKVLHNADETWVVEKDHILTFIRNNIQCCMNSQTEYSHKRDELSSKVESNKAISQLSEQIRSEERKLSDFEELEKKQEALVAHWSVLKQQLLEDVLHFKKKHQEFADVVNRSSSFQTEDDLDFSVLVPFRSTAFLQSVQSIVHNTNLKTQLKVFSDDSITEAEFWSNLPDLIEAIISGVIKLKGGKTTEVALRTLLTDWYNTTYSVKMDGDEIDSMSPGKKALVLLKLLIGMAETKCPILIDQPEDDLDNRSIFNDLIPYIQKKKKERQIIIVTHNANIVLGADAEQVIVANQNGKGAPNQSFRFEYLSGSIENDLADDNSSSFVLPSKGIQQHICEVLEGGEIAFKLRKDKYRLK